MKPFLRMGLKAADLYSMKDPLIAFNGAWIIPASPMAGKSAPPEVEELSEEGEIHPKR
ncbi:hypothetical protein QJS10_CPA01g01869 [Acorus calamus]|uniref:Uncharacterized protein n=1 Tax=Acorus calamus TaxID=4465 RepID=A0AAV9FNX0_ACOCL|nr:hypothetical protein QJS10_CPA01g01869 [Acorus calamus]